MHSLLPPSSPSIAPSRLDSHEKLRIRTAAYRATRLYPGPVGQMICRELLAWEEFGYRLARDKLIAQLIDDIMKTPSPEATEETRSTV